MVYSRCSLHLRLTSNLLIKILPGGGGASKPLSGAESSSPEQATSADTTPSRGTHGVSDEPSQITQQVSVGEGATGAATASNAAADMSDLASPSASDGTSASVSTSGQIAGKVSLSNENTPAVAGIILYDNLKYEVQPDGTTVKLVGLSDTQPDGSHKDAITRLQDDVVIPSHVPSGNELFEVVEVGSRALANCIRLTAIVLPDSVQTVAEDAFDGCTSLTSIEVSANSQHFSQHDGMLFDKRAESLVRCPEGKRGSATLPASVANVNCKAFRGCVNLTAVLLAPVDPSTAAPAPFFASYNGALYSADLRTLVFCPDGAGTAAVLAPETEVIGPKAFAACTLASLTAPGTVRDIASDAFNDETKASAMVVLPPTADYAARKHTWEAAGFSHFAESVEPGQTVQQHTMGEGDETAQGFAFTLLDDYTLSVTWEGAADPAPNLEIPATAEVGGVSYRVSTVAAHAFTNRASLIGVTLPSGVTAVGEGAFAGCTSLARVVLPDALGVIGERAFEATALADVCLPSSVQTIGSRAFAACELLTRVVDLGTPQVADDALAGCANVSLYCPFNEAGTYPWNLGLIANENHLKPYGLSLPAELLALEVGQQSNLFEGGICKSPESTELAFSYAAKPLSVENGTVVGKNAGTSDISASLTLDGITLARAVRTVVVTPVPEPRGSETKPVEPTTTPDDIPVVSLLSNLDNSVASLAASSFNSPDNTLTYTVTNATTNTVSVSKGAVEPTGALVIPGTVQNEGITYTVTKTSWGAFSNCKGIISVTLPNTMTTIGGMSFSHCEAMTSISIPESVTSIEGHAFRWCFALPSITLPSTLTSIGASSFGACVALTDINIPDSVTSFEGYMFDGCPNLHSVTLGTGVQNIGDATFQECFGLQYLIVKGNPTINAAAFNRVTDLSKINVYIPGGTVGDADVATRKAVWESVGISASQVCAALGFTSLPSDCCTVYAADKTQVNGEIVIPPYYNGWRVTEIGSFYRCENLTSIKMPDSVWKIQAGAFRFCRQLAVPEFSPNLRFIDSNAFAACTSFKEFTLPDTVTEIGTYVFDGCEFMESFTIGAGVTAIPSLFFKNCHSLKNITVKGNVQEISSQAFEVIPAETIPTIAIHLPVGTVGGASFTQRHKVWYDAGFRTFDPTFRTATFDGHGGSSPASQTVEPSMPATDPGVSTRANYQFNGWYTESEGGSLWDFNTPLNADVTLHAHWTGDTHTVTFLANGGSGNMSPQSFVYGSPAVPLNANTFQRTGYTFARWDTQANGRGSSYANSQGIANLATDLTLHAQWTPNSNTPYLVRHWTQKLNAGTDHTQENFKLHLEESLIGTTDTQVTPAVKDITGFQAPAATVATIKGDGTVVVDYYYLRNSYSFTLTDAAGISTQGSTTTGMYQFEAPLKLQATPLDGYAFDRWTFAPITFNPEGATVEFTMPDSSVVATPVAHTLTYDIDYHLNDGVQEPGAPTGYTVLDAVTLPTAPTKENYTFEGWYGSADFSGERIKNIPAGSTGKKEFFAKWERVQRTVTFETFGGSTISPVQVPHGDAVAAPTAPTREGYAFAGWFADDQLTIRYTFTMPVTGNITLYARWVTPSGALATDDGEQNASWSFENGTLAIDCDPRTSISNLGWSVDETGQVVAANNAWAPLRSQVERVRMNPSVRATSMAAWFAGMENLRAADDAFIPSNACNVSGLFAGCEKLVSLPAGLGLPDGAQDMAGMFRGCTALASLPEGFTIPANATRLASMFQGCTSLTALPEGFTIPAEATCTTPGENLMSNMFQGCDHLTVLPESFAFTPEQAPTASNPFKASAPGTVTYYAGSNNTVKTYDWPSQNRTFAAPGDPTNPLPDSVRLVVFKTPSQTDPGLWDVYATTLTNDQGKVPNPGNPSRFGYPFQGWCLNPANPQTFDFTAVPEGEGTVELFATFGPVILRYQVPLVACVQIDATGTPTADALSFTSYTPEAVKVSQVKGVFGGGASTLLPTLATDGAKVAVEVQVPDQAAATVPLAATADEATAVALSLELPTSTGFDDPGTTTGSITLHLNGAHVSYRETPVENVATLHWTVGLA